MLPSFVSSEVISWKWVLTAILFLLSLNGVLAQNCKTTGCSTSFEPCCSQWGYCGNTEDHCSKAKGCYSGCWTTSTVYTNGNCKSTGCRSNVNGPCCGADGNCGRSASACDRNKGCFSGCWTATDGCKFNGCNLTSADPCCSQWGYCGRTAEYCAVDKGCISGCWPSNKNYQYGNTNCLRVGCPDSNYPCCSQWGHCGSTAAYCDVNQGCKSGCWKSTTSTTTNLVGRLVHQGFISNTKSKDSWLTARSTFFGVVRDLYALSSMSGVRSTWTTVSNQKASAEANGDAYWLGDPRVYIDNVKPYVSDSQARDVLSVLSVSAIRLIAMKPQECSGTEKVDFCSRPFPASDKATLSCTRYNCFFSPGVPCITRSNRIARCSSPTFFSGNAIKCPALSCKPATKRSLDTILEISSTGDRKRDLTGSYYAGVLRDLLKRRVEMRRGVRGGGEEKKKRIGSDPELLDRKELRAYCPSSLRCETCGVSTDTFTSQCTANFLGDVLCCQCAFDFGTNTWDS